MKKLFKYISLLSIILHFLLPIHIFAEYSPFSNAKNARELIKMAEEKHSSKNKYIVSYNLNIKAQIYENDIEHIEKSSVKEEVSIINGKVKIIKTINGKFWSIQ